LKLEARKKEEEEPFVDIRIINKQIDTTMDAAWDDGTDESFARLLGILEGRHIDHRHTNKQVTALMIAAAKNKIDVAKKLLSRGADPAAVACNEFTALKWAVEGGHEDMANLIKKHLKTGISNTQDQERLHAYQKKAGFGDDKIDADLVAKLVAHLSKQCPPGAILVFLPGLEEILQAKDKLDAAIRQAGKTEYKVFMMHSNMQVNTGLKFVIFLNSINL